LWACVWVWRMPLALLMQGKEWLSHNGSCRWVTREQAARTWDVCKHVTSFVPCFICNTFFIRVEFKIFIQTR
jgi:hypothetical protein